MELKELQESLQKTLHDFRGYVDKELQEIRERGAADPGTSEAVVKLGARIDELQAKIQRPENPAAVSGDLKSDRKDLVEFMKSGTLSAEAVARQKSMSVGSDTGGGFLVSPDTSGRIVSRIYDTTPMRQIAQVVPISSDKLIGSVDRDEVSSGWVGETASRAETDTPVLGQWEIAVHEQYAEPRITQQLLDDAAIDPGAYLEAKVAEYFSRQENAAFVTGTGIQKPKGFTVYTAVATADSSRTWGQIEYVATGSAGDWLASNADKIYDLEFALNPGYRIAASFLAHKSAILKLRKFKDGNGNFLWEPSMQVGQPPTLIGYPLREAPDLPSVASNSLSLWFGDWREAYLIVDRLGIRVLRDPFTTKPYVKFYTTKRVGGAVINFDALKAFKFSAS